ncbi:MAG: hypothetical protein K9G11_04710 [Rickettsiaceae bacterium]|nr:hypothetical protein [Rickettsiaceae bacterium]
MVYLELTIIVVGALCQGKEHNDATTFPLGDFAFAFSLITTVFVSPIL